MEYMCCYVTQRTTTIYHETETLPKSQTTQKKTVVIDLGNREILSVMKPEKVECLWFSARSRVGI